MSQIKKTVCRQTGDECFSLKLENGLSVYISPNKKRVASAIFSVQFGSVNSNFVLSDGTQVSLPDGMAHFLEHKTFETEDGGDAFDLFAQTGADANAFTSFNKTSYIFSCVDEFYESLGILLHFVMHPHFTPESVEKEKGIIIQEIAMYDDNPSWQSRSEVMRGLYGEESPLATDIAGTSESVSRADSEMLYSIHKTFYTPENMSLCVVGNVSVEKVIQACKGIDTSSDKEIPKTVLPSDTRQAKEQYREKYMPVSRSVFCFGVKDVPLSDGDEMYRRACAISVISHALFSQSSEFYSDMYDRGIINNTFSSGYEYTEYYAMYMFCGETDAVQTLYDELCRYIEQVKENGIDKELFDNARRAVYANSLRSFESSTSTCENMSEVYENVFLTPEIISNITYSYAMKVFRELFCPQAYTLSVIKPLEEKGE